MIETIGLFGALAVVLAILLNKDRLDMADNFAYSISFAVVVFLMGILVPMFGGMIEGTIVGLDDVLMSSIGRLVSTFFMYWVGVLVVKVEEAI